MYDDFDPDFYEAQYPQTIKYWPDAPMSRRERLLHHYVHFGQSQNMFRNVREWQQSRTGVLSGFHAGNIDPDFDEVFYKQVYGYYVADYLADVKGKITERQRLYNHYINYNSTAFRNEKEFLLHEQQWADENEKLLSFQEMLTDTDIVLYTQFFAATAEVTSSNIYCLYKNLSNPHIDRVVVFVEQGSSFCDIFSSKLAVQPLSERLTYQYWYDFAAYSEPSSIKLLANSDIYFDDTINVLRKITEWPDIRLYGSSRKDLSKRGELQRSREFYTEACPPIQAQRSQDCWVFKTPLQHFDKNYRLGYLHCDCTLRASLRSANMQFANLWQHLNAIHVDWREQKTRQAYNIDE